MKHSIDKEQYTPMRKWICLATMVFVLVAGYIGYCVVTHSMVFGKEYYLAEMPIRPKPTFYVSDTGFILDKEWANDETKIITRSSMMRRIHLNYFNYDILFAEQDLPKPKRTEVENILRNNVAAWNSIIYNSSGEKVGLFYLFLQNDESVRCLIYLFPSGKSSVGEGKDEHGDWNFMLLRSTNADYNEWRKSIGGF